MPDQSRRFATGDDLVAIARAAHDAYEPADGAIVHDASYVHTDANYTAAEKEKLASIDLEDLATKEDATPTRTSDGSTAGPVLSLSAEGWAEQDTTVDPPSPSPSYPQEIRVARGHEVTGKTGRYVDLEITHDGSTTTVPIPLPSKGFAASLPDGTADTLTIDGAGKVTWEQGVGYVASYAGESVGSTYLSTTGQLTTGAEVHYKLATPTTEDVGYVDLSVPVGAELRISELEGLSVEYFTDEATVTLARQWYERVDAEVAKPLVDLRSDVADVASDVAELVTDAATTRASLATVTAGLADLTAVVQSNASRITEVERRIDSARRALLTKTGGYYDNASITAFLAARFDGKLYGYSEPKTTSTEVTKTGANAGIPNPVLGTATVAGSSRYRDLGPFQWFAAKGNVDADGVPHMAVIRGIDSEDAWEACDEDVWAIHPVVWYDVDDTGTAVTGSVSDTWHSELKPNPQAYLPDGTLRPYMVRPRYALGIDSQGNPHSKSGLRGYAHASFFNSSHNNLITNLDYANTGYSGKSIYDSWYDIFMSRMIYGTKDFQTVMQGCTSYTYQYNPAVAETAVKRVVLTNSQAAGLVVGSSMMLGTRVGASSNDRNTSQNFDIFDGAVITSIETYDSANKAVYFDVEEAFDVDTTCLLSTAPWHSGSCDSMDWDGSPTNPNSAKEPAFFQGAEILTGVTEVLAGVIVSNDGTTGWTPYVTHDTRDDATSLTANFVAAGNPLPTTDADGWKYPLYLSDHMGLMYGEQTGGSTTTGASDGHYTNKLETTGLREWPSAGSLNYGRIAGLAYVHGTIGLDYVNWNFWSRLSGTGRSRG